MTKKNEATVVEATTSNEPTLAQQVETIAKDTSKNVSIRIRELFALTNKMGDVKRALDAAGYVTKNKTPIRFQHVRNVLKQQPKKEG